MRITEIEINNFRAFYGKHTITLGRGGKNLMVYGENGSGKSSFFLALRSFFEASMHQVDFRGFENIFIPENQKDTVYIQLKIKQNERSSSETVIKVDALNNIITGNDKLLIANANKVKGFFDYKSLLKTHLVDTDEVNIFPMLIEEILFDQENRFTTRTLGRDWQDILYDSHEIKQGRLVVDALKNKIDNFNLGVKEKIQTIEDDTNIFMSKFGYGIKIELHFTGIEYVGRRDISNQNINIKIDFVSKPIPKHQHFLNEAKLSALAISLYLASIKSNPGEGILKVLVLDDLLIGLDMSNRLPLLDILKDYFGEDFQIILTTYDRVWYEIVKNYFGDDNWQYIDIYSGKIAEYDFEMPVIRQHNDYINQAQIHLDNRDYKASAVYIRSEFEKLIKDFCEKKELLVKYNSTQKKLTSEDFWNAIKNQTTIDQALIREIEMCRGTVMNPISHDNLSQPQFQVELQNSIIAVRKLKNPAFVKDRNKSFERLKAKIIELESDIVAKDNTISQMHARLGQQP